MEDVTPKWLPRVLVIGPGGVKGLKTLGFLATIEDSVLLNYIDTYCGVSVGAVISLLMVAGYTIREIIGQAILLDIFNEIEPFDFHMVSKNRGLISTEPARRLLTNKLIEKFGKVPSLYHLYMITGKAFIAVTLNSTDEKAEILTPFSHPTMSAIDAVIFSMNIPFLFYQLIYDGKIYVDGAFANPYPVDYFDDGQTNILGIFMKNKEDDIIIQSKNKILHKLDDSENLSTFGDYFIKIIQSLINQKYNDNLRNSSDKCRHVCLAVTQISTKVDVKDKAIMIVEGFNEGKEFLKQLDHEYRKDCNKKQYYQYPDYYNNPDFQAQI